VCDFLKSLEIFVDVPRHLTLLSNTKRFMGKSHKHVCLIKRNPSLNHFLYEEFLEEVFDFEDFDLDGDFVRIAETRSVLFNFHMFVMGVTRSLAICCRSFFVMQSRLRRRGRGAGRWAGEFI
jgi:hypothetical protein